MNPSGQSIFSYLRHIPIHSTKSKFPLGSKSVVFTTEVIAIMYGMVDKGQDIILESSMQLLKSLKYHEKYIDTNKNIIIPVIIVEGQMYEYLYENEEVKKIFELNNLSNGVPFDPTPTIIDIVHISKFQNYLDKINKSVLK